MTVSIKMLGHGVAVSCPDTGEVQQVALVEGVPGFPNIHETVTFLAVHGVHNVRRFTCYLVAYPVRFALCARKRLGSDDVGTDSAPLGSTWSTRATLVEELLVVLLMDQYVLKVAVTPKCDDGNFRKHLSHPV